MARTFRVPNESGYSVSAAEGRDMAEIRKLAAILCSDVVGYSRLAGADEDRILARLRALRSDLIDPTIPERRDRPTAQVGLGRYEIISELTDLPFGADSD